MSEIKLKEIKCPVCGAPLQLKDTGYGQTECEYCHAIIYAQREDTTKTGNIVVYNQEDNRPIATLNIPIGWTIKNAFVNYAKSTLQIPYSVCVDIENNMGSIIHVETGNSFEGFGAAAHLGQTQAMHTMQKPFETVDMYLNEFVAEMGRVNNRSIKFVKDLEIPVENYNRENDFREYQERIQREAQQNGMSYGVTPTIQALYCDSACRLYEIESGRVIVAYTKEYGNMVSIGGGFGAIGNLFGQLFSKNTNNQNQAQAQSPVYYGQFRNPNIGESYSWMSDPVFILITSKEECDDIVKNAYKQICSSFKLAPEVVAEYRNLKMQWEQENAMMRNNQAQAQWQNGQNLINIGQQRMAANQNYINSMMERSNRQYQSQRESYNSRVAAQDRMRDARSEAIRGVNTYIKPDGKEIEVSVTADTVWINGKGEIVGGGKGFNPGFGWTKLERK